MLLSKAFALYRLEVILFKNQSRKTEEHHQVACNSLIRFAGDVEIEKLTFDTVRRWKNSLELQNRSPNTIRGYLIKLRCVLKYSQKKGINCIDYEEVLLPRRKTRKAPAFLTEEEIALLIKAALQNRERKQGLRNACIVSMIYSCGLRVSEASAMNISDTHYDSFVITGKGDNDRPGFIDARTRKLLNKYLATRIDNCEALFVSDQHGDRITSDTIQEVYRNLRKKAGITGKRITPHIGRHSFATNFLRNNGNMRHLQAMLGHRSLETTQIYAHAVDEDLHLAFKKYHTITKPKLYTEKR